MQISDPQARALGLVTGYLADQVLADPARFHPVAGFGWVAQRLERILYADSKLAGFAYSTILAGSAAAGGMIAERLTDGRPLLKYSATAIVTWAVLGGRSLHAEAVIIQDMMNEGDLAAARQQLTHLVGRNTEALDVEGISRAVIESVAENTSDAVVAPLFAAAVGGMSGLISYRACNTLDAMVGHKSVRYRNFGWYSARLDDGMNLVPARASALLAAAWAPSAGGRSRDAIRIWRRDAALHPSPNAGPVEAAFAGALSIRLGGVNTYGDAVENRHVLGDGEAASPQAITRSLRLAALVSGTAMALSALSAIAAPKLRRARHHARQVHSA